MAMAGEGPRESAASAIRNADHIASLVSAGDQDRYWAGLLMPRPARDHLFALYAFNIELARIGEQVREPQLGEIRLQWWRDALATASEVSGHPVADGIKAACAACDLPAKWLGAMIDARSLDVQRASIASMDELEAYLDATAGMVFRLGAWIAGARDEAASLAAREAALAYGLTGLMRALPYHVRRGQLYLPADFLSAFGVEPAAVMAGQENTGLCTALGVLRERAGGHLTAFRAAAKALPAAALPVFLPLALVPPYLRKLAEPAHRPLADLAQLNPLNRFARIWLANLRGRV